MISRPRIEESALIPIIPLMIRLFQLGLGGNGGILTCKLAIVDILAWSEVRGARKEMLYIR
jgi:hypothetical protein